MLQKLLENLEKKRKDLLEEAEKLTGDRIIADQAFREININSLSVKNYLGQLEKRGYPIKEDFCSDPRIYGEDLDYRLIINHLSNHLFRMGDVITQLREGRFRPSFTLRR